MNIELFIFAKDAAAIDSPSQFEISILGGANTLVLPVRLDKLSLDRLRREFMRYGFVSPMWKQFYETVSKFKFEPVLTPVPQPQTDDDFMLPLSLVSGDTVYLIIRELGIETDIQSLIMAH